MPLEVQVAQSALQAMQRPESLYVPAGHVVIVEQTPLYASCPLAGQDVQYVEDEEQLEHVELQAE